MIYINLNNSRRKKAKTPNKKIKDQFIKNN